MYIQLVSKTMLGLRQFCNVSRHILWEYMIKDLLPIHINIKTRHSRSNFKICSRAYGTSLKIPENIIQTCDMQNGMRIICEYKKSLTTTVGCFLPAGAIYEKPQERGSALFLEHLLFRRTTERSQRQIEEELAEIGGKLSAIATRDIFLFYGTVPSCEVDKLIEIFVDIILHGVICDEDVLSEKCIILHELDKIELDYEKVIMDYLPTIAYQGTELEKSIYPKSQVIKNFCAEALRNFKNRLFKPHFITLVSSGAICLQELQNTICEHFTDTEDKPLSEICKTKTLTGMQYYRFSGAELRLRDDDEELGYVAIGLEGPGYMNYEDYYTFIVAKQIVGSWDMSHGGANHNASYLAHCAFNTDMCYIYKSFILPWARTSIWGCYFVCDKLKLEDMVYMLQTEWIRLCTTITQKEVTRAINQCKTIEQMKLDNSVDRFFDIVNSYSRRGYYEPFHVRLARYENVTASMIRDAAAKYIYDQSPTVIALGRIENLPDYCLIRRGLYSLRY